jgi:TetR/AcrR family transcriptional regulator
VPKPTFANLPDAKRQAIIAIAIEEFAAHPYAVASVSRIVARAGIAKGSLYLYFENKQELFLFLLDHAAQAQLQLLRELAPPDPDAGFFALLRWQMSASVRVGVAAPQLVQLMYRAFSADLPFRDQAARRMQSAGAEHMLPLIRQGIEQGEIDPAIDPELAAFAVTSLLGDLHTLITGRLGLSAGDAAADVEQLVGPEVERIYDSVLHLLQYGLHARNPSGEQE